MGTAKKNKPKKSADDRPASVRDALGLNRDLSWLEFNDRVLQLAEDERLPLLERTKFLAIFATNLDEFFMKRFGLAKRRLAEGVGREPSPRDGWTLPELLAEMRRVVVALQTRQARCWLEGIRPSLAAAGVKVRAFGELEGAEKKQITRWFERNVFPILTPLAVDPSHRFPFISNMSENFGLMIRRGAGPRIFARVKIPSVVARYVPVGDESGSGGFVALDEVIAGHLDRLFPGAEITDVTAFRVTRSAAVADDDDDVDDLLQQVEDELRRRRFASAVRIETTPDASDDVLQFVTTQLGIGDADIYRREGPLEYEDLFALVSLPRPDLHREPWSPVPAPELLRLGPRSAVGGRGAVIENGDEDDAGVGSIFDVIRERDVLLHHPYESFNDSVERFIAEAAADPDVLAIKQTIYRTSPDSPFVRSLIRAAESGKNVAALVELRARFDEERNVSFARQLEHAGVHVAYGVVGLKTHCKCSLVVRRETVDGQPGLRAYAHIGTGNYHPKTAQLYTDLGLLTADPDLTEDVVRIFNTLTGSVERQEFERLLVAPHDMRNAFLAMIEGEMAAAGEGRPASVVAKMNQLEYEKIIDKLYDASAAGVRILLFVRGFCTLRAGVPGLSENIEVRSVVGRFLEHSRVFFFANAGEPLGEGDRIDEATGLPEDAKAGRYFISSADWMSRNLSDRLEASAPVDCPDARSQLRRLMGVLALDRRNAWRLLPGGRYERLEAEPGLPDDHESRLGTFQCLQRDAVQRST
ncbi:MAG: polyphosphate kinase 1 [Planctomycetota bacterium]